MKTLDDALKAAIEVFTNLSPEQQEAVFREQRKSWVRGQVGEGSARRIADYLDPQPVSAPVIPEGWRLVPVELTRDQIDKGVMAVVRAGKSGKSVDDQMRFAFEEMIFTAPPAPLRTEADVRKEARREALEEAVAFIASQRNDIPMMGEEAAAAAAIRALIEKES